MRLFSNFIFFVVALLCAAAASSAATLVGSWSNNYLSLKMTLRTSDGVTDVQATMLQGTTGWYAFGIGPTMSKAKIVVMWMNADGSPTVSLRDPSPHTTPAPSSNQSMITNITSSLPGTIHFTMPLSSSDYSLSDQSKYFIWANSPQSPPNKDPATSIDRHNARGTFSLTFAVVSPGPGSTTTAPTSTGSNPGPTPGLGSGSSDDGSGQSPLPYQTLVITHGTLGFAAWAVFAPLSISIARFGRHLSKWVPLHYGIHIVGVMLLTIVVFIIGYIQSNGIHFDTAHKIIGLTIFVVMFIQIFLGWLSHHLFDPARTHRPIRNHLHRFFGVSLLILGFVQVWLGLVEYDVSMPVQIAYFCWIGLWVCVFVIFLFFFGGAKCTNPL